MVSLTTSRLLATAYVAKYDSSGAIVWVSPFYGSTNGSDPGDSSANAVMIDGSNNVVVGGYYQGPVDFNPGWGMTWLQARGGFIAKLGSSNGALSWARPGSSDFAIARLTPSGQMDYSFGIAGRQTVNTGRADSIVIQSNGYIVVGGSYSVFYFNGTDKVG